MIEIKKQIEKVYAEALKKLPKIKKNNGMLGVLQNRINQTITNTEQIEKVNANDYLVKNGNKDEEKKELITYLQEMILKYSKQFITQ